MPCSIYKYFYSAYGIGLYSPSRPRSAVTRKGGSTPDLADKHQSGETGFPKTATRRREEEPQANQTNLQVAEIVLSRRGKTFQVGSDPNRLVEYDVATHWWIHPLPLALTRPEMLH